MNPISPSHHFPWGILVGAGAAAITGTGIYWLVKRYGPETEGFETTYVRPDHPVPELRSEAKAYDFLVRHRYLQAEPGLSDEDKTRIIRKRFGTPALIPAEFFIFGKQAREAEKATTADRAGRRVIFLSPP